MRRTEDESFFTRRLNTPVQGCIHGATLILTQDYGICPIRDLVGRSIYVWDGENYVRARVAFSGPKSLVITTLSDGTVLKTSPNHQFLVRGTTGNERFVRACDLNPDDGNQRVVMSTCAGDWSTPSRFPEVLVSKAPNGNNWNLASVNDSERLGELLGWIAGDGTVSDRAVTVIVADNKITALSRLEETLNRIGEVHKRCVDSYGRGRSRKESLHNLCLYSKSLATQLQSLCLKEGVPEVVLTNRESLIGYLRGLFSADGHVGRDGILLTLGKGFVKQAWAQQIHQCLSFLGVRSRVRSYTGDRSVVQIRKADTSIFLDRIGFLVDRKTEKAEAVVPTCFSPAYGSAHTVKSVVQTGEIVGMFDVVDSDTGRFAAAGVVTHNTAGDGLKAAASLLYERRAECPDAVLVLFVHDELVCEVSEENADQAAEWLKRCMIDGMKDLIAPVEVVVETSWGYDWAGRKER